MIANPTQHKGREAEYHLRQAERHYQSDDEFAFYLSAFLSAARSITFHMQKQYGNQDGFPEWYCAVQTRMVADSDLKYLNEARVEDVHQRPVSTRATRAISASVDAVLVKKGEEDIVDERSEVTSDTTAPQPRTLMRFFAGRNDIEVIKYCGTQLAKLTDLVAKCEKQYPTTRSNRTLD